jgi:hypothetical protein
MAVSCLSALTGSGRKRLMRRESEVSAGAEVHS